MTWRGRASLLLLAGLLFVAASPALARIVMGGGVTALSGGAGAIDINGTPTAGQVAIWVDADTLEGVSTLPLNYAAASVSTAGTVTTSTEYVDAGAGGVTRTLPAAASGTSTRRFRVLKVAGAGALTVAPAGADTINGVNAALPAITAQWAGYDMQESAVNGWVAQPISSTAGGAATFPLIGTSAANPCFAVGPNGATNPALQVNCSAATGVTGVQVVQAATGIATILQATGTAASEGIRLQSKSAGSVLLTVPGGTGLIQFQVGGTNVQSLSINGTAFNMAGTQTIADTNTIAGDACGSIKRITAAAPVTTNTTNTFTAPGGHPPWL